MSDLPEPLRGIEAKLKRSKAHLDALEEEVSGVFEGLHGEPIVITRELERNADGKTGVFVIKVAHVKVPPIEVGVKIGDVIHSLRSALDHMAWQLGRLNRKGADPHGQTAFPICRTRADFESKTTQGVLRHIHRDHRALIEKCQPYHGGDFEPLLFLNELSRTDKHRVVTTLLTAQGESSTTITAEQDCILGSQGLIFGMLAGKPLEVGAEIARVPVTITGPNPQIEVETDAAYFVAFGNGSEIFQTLGNIGYAVNVVLLRIVPLFDTPAGRKLGSSVKDEFHEWPRGFQKVTIRGVDEHGNVVMEGSDVLDEAALDAAQSAAREASPE